jgi:hypothetical protein
VHAISSALRSRGSQSSARAGPALLGRRSAFHGKELLLLSASSAGSRSAQQIEVDSASNLEAHFTWSDHHGQYWQEMCSKAFVWLRAFSA